MMLSMFSQAIIAAVCACLLVPALAQGPSASVGLAMVPSPAVEMPVVSDMGYNITGFENTTSYYGDVIIPVNSTIVPAPNVPASLVPSGCNILNQFNIANWTGPLPCTPVAGAVPGITAGSNTSTSNATCADLRGKVVVITGASTGIGRATANRLAAAGATVIGTSRWPWRYPVPANWQLYQMDQTQSSSVKQFIDHVASVYGRIDILYLNAGQQFVGDTANSDLRQMELVFQTNFWGPVRVMQAALPLMPSVGYARIMLTTSVESQEAAPGYLPYTASKWALMALQEEWYSSHANASTNIDFVTILPGTVNSSLGYHLVYGCPELFDTVQGKAVTQYKTGLDPRAVAEAVYRLLINPTPPLRNMIMQDSQWSQLLPLFCRRYTLPLEDFYSNTPNGPDISAYLGTQGEVGMHESYNCSIHCGGAQFCGAGPLGGETGGYGSIVAYPSTPVDFIGAASS